MGAVAEPYTGTSKPSLKVQETSPPMLPLQLLTHVFSDFNNISGDAVEYILFCLDLRFRNGTCPNTFPSLASGTWT